MKKTFYNSPEVKIFAVKPYQHLLQTSPTSSTDSFGKTDGSWDPDNE